jgi:Leucine-rich repeat (LRR) protein
MSSEEEIKNKNLKSLDLSFKKLEDIPKYVFELTSLENLNLSHNQLKELPKEITKLTSLKTLDISWNHILHNLDFLPKSIKVTHAWNR